MPRQHVAIGRRQQPGIAELDRVLESRRQPREEPVQPRVELRGREPLVPLSLYFKDGRAKIEIAVAKGKKLYDKRQALLERQSKREAERAMSRARRAGRAGPS